MTRRSLARLVAALVVLLALSSGAGAATVTLSQAQLLAAEEATILFGGNGQVLSRVADGSGVLFVIEGGTIDFGKVALRVRLFGADLTAFSDFGLRIDVVSAPNPIEVNPFIFTGSAGTIFNQDVPGVKTEGESFDSFVPLLGVPQLDDTHSLGFQYFTAGDIEAPASQIVSLRVSPMPGATVIPEPASFLLTAIGLAGLSFRRRRPTPPGRSGA